LCDAGLRFDGDSRDELIEGSFWYGFANTNELVTDPPLNAAGLLPLQRSQDGRAGSAPELREEPTTWTGTGERSIRLVEERL
jgi:hypothetical protein